MRYVDFVNEIQNFNLQIQDEVNRCNLTELKVHKKSEDKEQITSDNELNEINEELE